MQSPHNQKIELIQKYTTCNFRFYIQFIAPLKHFKIWHISYIRKPPEKTQNCISNYSFIYSSENQVAPNEKRKKSKISKHIFLFQIFGPSLVSIVVVIIIIFFWKHSHYNAT